MSNIKKGSKLTVSTANGISRDISNNLGVLEVSGPGMSDVGMVYGSNPAHFVIGSTDVSGILQLGINQDGNTFIDANINNNHKDIIMQKYGGNIVVGSGVGSGSKVGIQTNAPNSTVHINSTDGIIIPVGTDGQRPDPAYQGMMRYNTTTSQFEGYGPGGNWGSLGGVKDVDGDTRIIAETSAGADNDALQFYTAGQQRLEINSAGNVGIGETIPAEKLVVNGNIRIQTSAGAGNGTYYKYDEILRTNDTIYIQASGTGNVAMCNGGGNVGIGTNSPSYKLAVNGTINCQDALFCRSGVYMPGWIYHDGDPDTQFGFSGDDTFTVKTDNGDRLIVNNTGVGIGRVPSHSLDVNNNAYFRGNITMDYGTKYAYASTGAAGSIYSDSTGRSGHFVGHTGSTNNVNPFYVLSYQHIPTESNELIVRNSSGSAVTSFYGLGFCHGAAPFLPNGIWHNSYGLYIAAGQSEPVAYFCGDYSNSNSNNNYIQGRLGVHTRWPKAGLHVNSYYSSSVSDYADNYTGNYYDWGPTDGIWLGQNSTPLFGQAHRSSGGYGWQTVDSNGWSGQGYGGDTDPHIFTHMNIGICCEYHIVIDNGYALLIMSDRRIKMGITDVDDGHALYKLRNIPCRNYSYKDFIKRGFDRSIGFIAQEVIEHYPEAVHIKTGIIPDVYLTFSNKKITWTECRDNSGNIVGYKLECFDQIRIKRDFTDPDIADTIREDIDISGVTYRFIVSHDGKKDIVKEVVGNPDNTFTFKEKWERVFCYGREVDDYHSLDESKLHTLNFSATQEIDRIQQKEIIKVGNLEYDLSKLSTSVQTIQIDLSNVNTTIQDQATTIQQQATTIQDQATKITTLETQIADILTRLSNLENPSSG